MHSDVYLLNSLKKFCANTLGSYISEVNVIDLIKLSRMLNLPKLESTAVEYIANNLEQVSLKYLSFIFLICLYLSVYRQSTLSRFGCF